MVEALVRYAQTDLAVPLLRAGADGFDVAAVDLDAANAAARTWCEEVNAVEHSETCAVPAQRLVEVEGPCATKQQRRRCVPERRAAATAPA